MKNGDITHVLDPVMLLDKSGWDDISATPPEKAYILTYDLRDITGVQKYAEALSKSTDTRLYLLQLLEQLRLVRRNL